MKASSSFRKLNTKEREIIDSLLAKTFRGRDEIREQINTSIVKDADCACGCLTINFTTKSTVKVTSKERIPVEASYFKNDRPYQILLHIIDGKVNELEFVSYSDHVDLDYPRGSALKITVNEK